MVTQDRLTCCFSLLLLQLRLLCDSLFGGEGDASERVAGHKQLELLSYLVSAHGMK
jgi:hypothetical protein